REKLNHVEFLGAGFGILHLANSLDVNEVTVTRGTILGNEKLLTPTHSQSQALMAYYTTLIDRSINAAAAAALNKYNCYDSKVFHVFPQYERYGIVYGSDISQCKGDVTR